MAVIVTDIILIVFNVAAALWCISSGNMLAAAGFGTATVTNVTLLLTDLHYRVGSR